MTIHVSKAPHMRFSFDDVTASEIRIRDINEANRETRDTRIIALPRGQYTDYRPTQSQRDRFKNDN